MLKSLEPLLLASYKYFKFTKDVSKPMAIKVPRSKSEFLEALSFSALQALEHTQRNHIVKYYFLR